ncbi:VCBS repeat-containing protein [Rhodobacteraceae bacterium D3-12]|nr:VCBS repeat-containing protein [Rhodobacteraceae bacterium D3-12]
MRPRAAKLIVCFAALFILAGTGAQAEVTRAEYADPTTEYAHGILGDAVEYATLKIYFKRALAKEKAAVIRAPKGHVFEDTAPRLWDVDGDGAPEVVTILTNIKRGAALAVFDENGLIARTPFIGRTHRWLAPVGVGDLDNDGRIEIAYVDRPHLAKVLRIWRLDGTRLRHVVDVEGLTNHKIGWDFIAGGVRDCGAGPEVITANAGWTQIMATRFVSGAVQRRAIVRFNSPSDFAAVMGCRQ